MARLLSLGVADTAEVWRSIGFAVDGAGRCSVDGTAIGLGAEGRGVVGWAVGDAPDLGELPTVAPIEMTAEPPEHPNGVIALDHVVIATPDLARTIGAFEQAGIGLRRTRQIGPADRPRAQAFFKLGRVVVEVVGPTTTSGPGPATFWGLAFTTADLDATAALLGDRLGPIKDAVQPGRRIATLDRVAGSGVPIVFMSI